jgi:SAM-dependent methyltransferase
MVSLGGALGSLLIGIVAPLTLSAYYELGLTLYVFALLATWLLWRKLHWAWRPVALVVCGFTLWSAFYSMYEFRREVIAMSRNFYGTLRVRESMPDEADRKRSLIHGGILHGDQYLDEIRRRTPTSYYQLNSGIGIAIRQKQHELSRPVRVGVVGLGTGTLAVYGETGDIFRFYEINPGVVDLARERFTYLQDTAANIEVALGDARLNLEREPPQQFDVLAIDAFSSDSIPVHLMTVEALAAYERHMQPDGIIAFHISNRFLQLHPVVEQLATARGLAVAWLEELRNDGSTVSDWILLSKEPAALLKPYIAAAAQPIPTKPDWRLWTDDFNNIVQVLR